jgi:hypothetical protein
MERKAIQAKQGFIKVLAIGLTFSNTRIHPNILPKIPKQINKPKLVAPTPKTKGSHKTVKRS